MNEQSEQKLRLCVQTVYSIQKGTVCERNGVETSEKDGVVIVRFPIELRTGDVARNTVLLGETFTQLYCELKPTLESKFCIRAATVANAANQVLRFGHIAVDSHDGRVFYTFAQLAAQPDSVPGALAVALMELEDWYSPVLDFLDSPMERQDMDDFIETAARISHQNENTMPTDELYDEDEAENDEP